MLGEKISEITAKIVATRVLPAEGGGVKLEASYQGQGRLLGVDTTEVGTYHAVMRPSGNLFGEGQGLAMGKDGDVTTWSGNGVGKPTGKGLAASWRYTIYYQTTSTKWSRLNGIAVVGEWEVDENGNAKGQAWEWK